MPERTEIENPFHRIMNASSIAFFGASNSPTTMGTTQILHLIKGGYQGRIWPVHPKEEKVLGIPAHRNVSELPETPELAVLVLPTNIVPDILDECGQKGIKRAVIISGGFKEMGQEGAELQERVNAVAEKHGIRFVGPNCIGVINAHNSMNFTFFPYTLGPGPLSLLSQSGTYVTQVLHYLRERGLRYSRAVSMGNEANLDLVDGLEYLGEDPDTGAIALYIEAIRRGREFVETAGQVSLKKPIVAYYVGGTETGARSGSSHTGAMGGDDVVHDGMFRQCGILRAPTVEEMYDWGWALACTSPPGGKRVAIISHSGGPITSMADSCARHGLQVPILSKKTREKIAPLVPKTGSTANPVDLTFSMNPAVMVSEIPKIVYESGEVDAVLIHGIMGSSFLREMEALAPEMIQHPQDPEKLRNIIDYVHSGLAELARSGCPVITSTFSGRDDYAVDYVMRNDVPLYPSPERAVAAMAAVMRYHRWRAGREN